MNEKKDIDIIQWLGSNLGNTKIVYEVFGKLDCSLGGLTKDYTTQEIIDRITQYERNKERKPKFDRRFRYRIYDTNYLIVKSGIINNVKNHQQAWTKARLILDEYLVKHPYGEYAVDVEKFSTFNKEYEES